MNESTAHLRVGRQAVVRDAFEKRTNHAPAIGVANGTAEVTDSDIDEKIASYIKHLRNTAYYTRLNITSS